VRSSELAGCRTGDSRNEEDIGVNRFPVGDAVLGRRSIVRVTERESEYVAECADGLLTINDSWCVTIAVNYARSVAIFAEHAQRRRPGRQPE
jgi:hypothetical protein